MVDCKTLNIEIKPLSFYNSLFNTVFCVSIFLPLFIPFSPHSLPFSLFLSLKSRPALSIHLPSFPHIITPACMLHLLQIKATPWSMVVQVWLQSHARVMYLLTGACYLHTRLSLSIKDKKLFLFLPYSTSQGFLSVQCNSDVVFCLIALFILLNLHVFGNQVLAISTAYEVTNVQANLKWYSQSCLYMSFEPLDELIPIPYFEDLKKKIIYTIEKN